MTNQKSTKRALLTSVLALLVCVTMLIGSTFAWFTDTANSGRNKIVSGNLDVELYFATPADYAAGNWTEVTSTTKLFDDSALYEPGYTELVYLKVKNAGTLALKYDMNLSFTEKTGINVYGDEFKLSDYISTRVIHSSEFGRMNLRENIPYFDAGIATFDLGVVLSEFAGSSADTMIGWDETALLAGEEIEVALALWMDTTVGNEANYMTGTTAPSIDLGVDLVATQYTHEEDSFGKDYDANATYPELPEAKTTDLGAISGIGNGGAITLADGTPFTVTKNEYSSYSMANPVSIDQAYLLEALETPEEAEKSPYRYWNADFVVTFDKDLISTEGTGLVGNYGDWGWIGFDAADFAVVEANTEYRLLASQGIAINYYELCTYVKDFVCGAFDDGTNAGTGMTVEVRLYETEDYITGNNSHNVETGAYKTAATIDYVF